MKTRVDKCQLKLCSALIAGILLVTVCSSFSAAAQISDETPILENDTGSAYQATPSVAWGDGAYFVVWRDGWHGMGGESSLYAILVDKRGRIVGRNKIVVAAGMGGAKVYPNVAFGNGVFFVVWQNQINRDNDVLGVRFSSDGALLDSKPIPIGRGPSTQALPEIDFDGNDFLVAYQTFEVDTSTFAGRVARIAPNGNIKETVRVGAPNPKVSSIGAKSLIVSGSTNIFTQLIKPHTKPPPRRMLVRYSKWSQFSIAGTSGKGWLVVDHRAPPDNWGWGGPGAMRCYFLRLNGQIDPGQAPLLRKDRSGNWSKLDNWLDLGERFNRKKDDSKRVWPYGQSEIVWDGRHFVVFWQRHHLRKKVHFYNADIAMARVDTWKPVDAKPILIAGGPADERWPAAASDGSGNVLCAYEKSDVSGVSRVYFRMIETQQY